MSTGDRAEKAGIVGLALVWLASTAPFLLDPARLSGVSRCALAALPWLAWSGAPRALRTEFERLTSVNDTLQQRFVAPLALELALFSPAIALGAWIDHDSAMGAHEIAITSAFAVFASLSLACASRLAAGSRRGVHFHALAWFVVIAFGPLITAALTLGGAPLYGAAPAWMRMLSVLSPLGWVAGRLRAEPAGAIPGSAGTLELPWLAFVGVLVLVAGAVAADRARAAEEGDR
jgi:hypothetical protein